MSIGSTDAYAQKFQCPQYVAIKELRGTENRQKLSRNWEKEADILQKMNDLKHPHIIRFLTAFRRGSPGNESHYLMFEWADGGNLCDFWETFPRLTLNANLVRSTLRQILGLAEAISRAHYPVSTSSPSGMNFRHGDLKPQNILWFKNGGDPNGIGLFKIGDWGLAKQHMLYTELRSFKTTTHGGTRIYEPPEEAADQGSKLVVPGQSGKKRSRLYDTWAMGCITLEFLIWLVYGYEQSAQFIARIIHSNPNAPRFYQVSQSTATVHDVAVRWMGHMAKDPIFKAGETALGGLLEVVRDRLLVVKLPERLGTSDFRSHVDLRRQHDISNNDDNSNREGPPATNAEAPDSTEDRPGIYVTGPGEEQNRQDNVSRLDLRQFSKAGPERARSDQFYDSMLEIAGEDMTDSYWFTGLPNPATGPYADNVPAIRQDGTYQAVYSEAHTRSRQDGQASQSEPRQMAGLGVPAVEQVRFYFFLHKNVVHVYSLIVYGNIRLYVSDFMSHCLAVMPMRDVNAHH